MGTVKIKDDSHHWFRPGLVIQLFLRGSRVQRKRAILTVASIAWGSLSLLLLLAFGEGLRHSLSTSSLGMGENLAICWPGSTSLSWEGLPTGRPVRPRIEDVALLRQRIDGLEEVAGEIFRGGTVVTHGETTATATVKGETHGFGEIRNHIPMPGGRFLNPLDAQRRRRSAFLGDKVAKTLFGDADPVGKKILLDKTPYTVVGVMKPKLMMGNYEGMDSEQISIPITTFKAQYGQDRLSTIVLKPARPELMEDVIRQMHEILGAKYGFDPEDERVFGIWDTVETFQFLVNMLVGIQVFLGIIGGLTLIIGGVGVANIMYAVVKDRTREIGVKMALGARRGWITGPIVLEGLLYTLLGGVAGLLMSVGLIVLLGMIPTEGNEALQMLGTPTLSLRIGVVSALILGFIGLLAGYFPARRAASINPADTLRYE
jgi:putative ABC transport system permease protein